MGRGDRRCISKSLLVLFFFFAVSAQTQLQQKLRAAPDLPSDAEWLDKATVPHHLKGFRGKVLLLDFWEYTCINCIRDFGVLKRWYTKYHADGLEIVGVHYAEFGMGHDAKNIRQAAQRFHLPWPIVSDTNGTTWKEYDAHVWPTRDLISQDGQLVMEVSGERYNLQLEQKIRELLQRDHPDIAKIAIDPDEDSFDPHCGVATQEAYLGDAYGRGAVSNKQPLQKDEVTDFHGDQTPPDGGVILASKWRGGADGVVGAANNSAASLQYHARSVYSVMSREGKKPLRIEITQDDKPLSPANAGKDVSIEGGKSYVEVDAPRMYDLIKNLQFGTHILRLSSAEKGLDLHSFSFGNDCQQTLSAEASGADQ